MTDDVKCSAMISTSKKKKRKELKLNMSLDKSFQIKRILREHAVDFNQLSTLFSQVGRREIFFQASREI